MLFLSGSPHRTNCKSPCPEHLATCCHNVHEVKFDQNLFNERRIGSGWVGLGWALLTWFLMDWTSTCNEHTLGHQDLLLCHATSEPRPVASILEPQIVKDL
ncbi:hypothetical protein Hanom_Chr14g01311751 [Helianthus anomalus]